MGKWLLEYVHCLRLLYLKKNVSIKIIILLRIIRTKQQSLVPFYEL